MQLSPLVQLRRWQESSFWRPAFVVGGTLLILVAASYRLSPAQIGLLTAGIVASWAVLFFWRWPLWGLVAIVPGTMLVGLTQRIGIGRYLNEAVLFLILLTGLWLADMVVRQKQISLVRSRPVTPLLALVIVAVLAFANGQLLWFFFADPAPMAAQIGGLALFALAAAAFLLVAHQVRELKWLRYMTWAFLLIGTVFIVGRLLPFLPITQWMQRGAFSSIFWLWFSALALSQALFNRELKMNWRLVLVGVTAMAFLTLWFQNRDWASGWLPSLIAIGILLWFRSWRMALVLGALAVAAKLALDPNLLNELLARDEYSILTRSAAWEIVLVQIVRVSPILGLGPANYYHYTPLFPILGWYVQFNSHNQYVDLVAQTGLVGLACFLWFAGEMGRLGWRLRERAPAGFARAYVYGALAGLVATLVAGMLADWVIPFVYNIGFIGFRSSLWAWMFLGGMVAIEQMTNRAAATDNRPSSSH
jgi:hypothetical protein